jgi:Domain of unknown function (DUF4260)
MSALIQPVAAPAGAWRRLRRPAYAVLTAALLTVLIVYVVRHGGWPAALAGAVAADLGLALGGGRGLARGQLHPRAVGLYNAAHRFWGPVALIAVAATGLLGTGWLVFGLAWALHIALDRAVGYGLRTPDGFQRGA